MRQSRQGAMETSTIIAKLTKWNKKYDRYEASSGQYIEITWGVSHRLTISTIDYMSWRIECSAFSQDYICGTSSMWTILACALQSPFRPII